MREALGTPESVFSWAESFTNLEKGAPPPDKRVFRLDRMRSLLAMFGDPHNGLRIVHVAGTKGKGSTSTLIACVLQAAGRRTGLYTSPHVHSAMERIQVPGEPPREDLIVKLGKAVKAAINARPAEGWPGHSAPTTFELLTLLAFLYFRDAGCTDAVVEVGIGGRLDATNVVRPEACVITPLDLEHTDVLGDTLEKIAFEKAGIIKPGAPVFIGLQTAAARKVFRQVCGECGAPGTFLDEEMQEIATRVDEHGTSFTLRLKGEQPVDFRLSLVGEFQAENAALAYLALRHTRPEILLSHFREGFGSATLPGRMEVRGGAPVIVLDGAHTPLAVTRLLETFSKVWPGDSILLFGSVSGKRPKEMADILAPAFKSIIISTPGTFKESNPQEVAEIFRGRNPATILEKDPRKALQLALEESAGRVPILVTGSFYMVSEVRKLL